MDSLHFILCQRWRGRGRQMEGGNKTAYVLGASVKLRKATISLRHVLSVWPHGTTRALIG